METSRRHRTVVDERPLATSIGDKIRVARRRAGITQQQLAEGRYTKAYISALENGHAKPSVAALNFIASRLDLPASHFLAGVDTRWSRLEADILLASGRWEEAEEAYRVLATQTTDRIALPEILRGQAEALCRLGRGIDAIDPAARAFEMFGAAGHEREAILAGYWLAYAQYMSENSAEARSTLRSLLDRLRASRQRDPDLEMRLLTAASNVETWEGNNLAAVAYLEEARALSRDLDDRRRAALLSAIATAYYEIGDVEGALRSGSQSLALYRVSDSEHEAALVANNLANVYLAIGNLSKATELAAEARREHEALHADRELATVLDTQARIRLAAGDTKAAIELADQAAASAQATENHKALADARVTLARAAASIGDLDRASEMYALAAGRLREHGPRVQAAAVLAEWAELAASKGDHAEAYRLAREALAKPSS
jgi:transcriptional regulator with XRE-family HTH domain